MPTASDKRGAPLRYLKGVGQLFTELSRLTGCPGEALACALEDAHFGPPLPSRPWISKVVKDARLPRATRPSEGTFWVVHFVQTELSAEWHGRVGTPPQPDTSIAMCWEPLSQALQLRVPSVRFKAPLSISFVAKFAADRLNQLRNWYGEKFNTVVMLTSRKFKLG